jgi:hypothetical protein
MPLIVFKLNAGIFITPWLILLEWVKEQLILVFAQGKLLLVGNPDLQLDQLLRKQPVL